MCKHLGHHHIDLGGGGRHLGGTGLVVIDDGLDLLRLGHYLPDQHLDLAAGFMSLARQLTHLIGDHGESSTSFTGPGRLDGRIECQQVGLIRNALDGGHELVDGGCAGIELMDGCEAASRLIRDGMGALGETGVGAPCLGNVLIQLAERRRVDLSPQELRQMVSNQLRETKYAEAYVVWARDVRERAYVEMRDPPQ